MTNAPAGLLADRRYLIEQLPGLDSTEVGIVGNVRHFGGYHCGRDRLRDNDYSNRTSRDRAGLTLDASALDIGMWSGTFHGKAHNLRTFSVWLVAQCKANTEDTRDIREVIYSPDGKVVRRFDNEGGSGTGDDSHLTHTHLSVYRDATKAGRHLLPVLTRYVRSIKGVPAMATLDNDDLLNIRVQTGLALYDMFWSMAKSVDVKASNGFVITDYDARAKPTRDNMLAVLVAPVLKSIADTDKANDAANALVDTANDEAAQRFHDDEMRAIGAAGEDEVTVDELAGMALPDMLAVLRSKVTDWDAFRAAVNAS